MKLLTKKILKKLPPLYATQDQNLANTKVIVKFFNPIGGQSWYASEFDPQEGIFFGFVNLGDDSLAELGYFSLKELKNLNLPLGFEVERDKFWNAETTLEDVMSFKKR